jgi:hypothetical protein
MKKFFAIAIIAASLAACNNSAIVLKQATAQLLRLIQLLWLLIQPARCLLILQKCLLTLQRRDTSAKK